MQALGAIAVLTLKAAVRYRLLAVLGILLVLTVVALPLVIKDDGTARGFIQILLTYTLTLISALLGLATLWIACGTLSQDLEEHHLEIIDVKPVARWQVWLGKWIGIMAFNGVLLGLSGLTVYFLLHWRAANLPEEQQATLREEIFVARASARLPAPELDEVVAQEIGRRTTADPQLAQLDPALLTRIVREEALASLQIVNPGYIRRWTIEVGDPETLRDLPLDVRVKFFTTSAYDTQIYTGNWLIGPPENARRYNIVNRLSPETPIQFEVPAGLIDNQGRLTVDFLNDNERTFLFPVTDGIEVLYRKGTFAANYLRGLLLIYCGLGLLSAMGLMAASFLSFPIAAFFTSTLLLVAFSGGTLSQIVEQRGISGVDSHTGKTANPSFIDPIAVGVAEVLLKAVEVVRGSSPVNQLSDGRLIPAAQLVQCAGYVVLGMGGCCGLLGMFILHRRELATAKSF